MIDNWAQFLVIPAKKLTVGNFLWFWKTFAIVRVKQFTAESFYAFFQSALAMCSATLFCKNIDTLVSIFYNLTWRAFWLDYIKVKYK